VGIIKAIYLLIRAFLVPRLSLAAENLALRQQVTPSVHTLCRVTVEPSFQFDLPSSTQAGYADVPKLRSRRPIVPLQQSFPALCVLFVYARGFPPFPSDEFCGKHNGPKLRFASRAQAAYHRGGRPGAQPGRRRITLSPS
jgi:hypothetical protein